MMNLKARMKQGEVVIGTWLTLAHPAIAEIIANAGYDYVVIDLEHSVITIRECEDMIRIISLSGSAPLVRLSSNDSVQIKRVMDAGAGGIIVPMVKSKIDAERAIKSAQYPPRGDRGVGLARAQGYGSEFELYKNWLQNDAVVILQVEHYECVENIQGISEVEGVDGFIVGPYDLSASLGYPGQFDHPKVKQFMDQVKILVSEMKMPWGIHVIEPDLDIAKKYISFGYRFLAYSLDIRILDTYYKSAVCELKKILK